MVNTAGQWWWGDWLYYGERTYGETYAQAVDESDYSYGTLRNAAWVASQIELSFRNDNLTFGHHYQVAALEQPQQEALLADAEAEQWSVQELRKAIKDKKRRSAWRPRQAEDLTQIVAEC